jgi:Leucine-rich repeat (LRR) protein
VLFVAFYFSADNNLVGSLPTEMGLLTNLNHISLYSNHIKGDIPSEFQELQSLNYWAMDTNEITGSLPSWINTLDNLEYLALSNNTMSGDLPSFEGSRLIELSLDENNFAGSIDNINAATSLKNVYLNNNLFVGKISDDTWNNLGEIVIADLSNNRLTGSFPASFYWFEEIDLSNNKLAGTIAPPLDDDSAADLPTVKINLSDNQLTGSIPSNIDLLSASLVSFDVSNNQLTGTIPTQLGSLSLLQSLYLSYNEFTSNTIPDLRGCKYLTEVSMAATNRKGYIPDWFRYLTNLQLLDLHSNVLTASIPSVLGLLDLSVLMLNGNKLTGVIPTELVRLTKLSTF